MIGAVVPSADQLGAAIAITGDANGWAGTVEINVDRDAPDIAVRVTRGPSRSVEGNAGAEDGLTRRSRNITFAAMVVRVEGKP